MSNRSRRQRAAVRAPHPHISLTEQIRTVKLYRRLASTSRVGEELGISGSAVRDRLYAIGCPLRSVGMSDRTISWERGVDETLQRLRRQRDAILNERHR